MKRFTTIRFTCAPYDLVEYLNVNIPTAKIIKIDEQKDFFDKEKKEYIILVDTKP